MKRERNSGIDLLRLVLMLMVCMLHVLGWGGLLDACEEGTVQYQIFWLLQFLCLCAVDSFGIISGYMASDRPQKYEKIVAMWLQAFFYSFLVTLLLRLAGLPSELGLRDLVKCAMPVIYKSFWYFSGYFGLFFAIPLLNRFLFSADTKQCKKTLLVIFVLFGCLECLDEPFSFLEGYSAVWLMILYCIGVLAKRIRLLEKQGMPVLIGLWAVCVLASWIGQVYLGFGRLNGYVSPMILLSGLFLVLIFARLPMGSRAAARTAKLSPLAFGIYLFHTSPAVWEQLQGISAFAAGKPVLLGVAIAFLIAMALFAAGLFVEFFRSLLARWLHVPLLSRRIAAFLTELLEKAVNLLPCEEVEGS